MPGLTETEKERIRKVAELPRFQRSPDLLVPEADTSEPDETVSTESD